MSVPSKVYVATKTNGVYYTSTFTAANPTWATANGGLPATDARQFALDPFTPETKQYLLLEASRTLYRRDDGGDWAAILTSAQALAKATGDAWGSLVWFAADKSLAGRLWIGFAGGSWVMEPYVAWQTIWMMYSDDYGATWTALAKVAESWTSPRPLHHIAVYGDNLFIRTDNGSTYFVYYSSDKGANWATAGEPWNGFGAINPLQPTIVHYNGASHHKTLSSAGTDSTVDDPGPARPDAIWFSTTDEHHQRIISSGKAYVTTDSWDTVNTPSAITPVPVSIAPGFSTDEDIMIVGLTLNSGAGHHHVVGLLDTEDDTTAAGKAGANCGSSPFTNSIPNTCGGLALDGVGAIADPLAHLYVYDVAFV